MGIAGKGSLSSTGGGILRKACGLVLTKMGHLNANMSMIINLSAMCTSTDPNIIVSVDRNVA